MNEKRVLQIFRDGHETRRSLTVPLLAGQQGNMQTLEAMAAIVREDRTQPDLRIFVLREIVGDVRGHDSLGEVMRCFDFAQRRIVYRQDPVAVERVADIWSTMYALNPREPEGDCGIKSVFFATCCALLGHKPVFVVARQRSDVAAFNHVYCGAVVGGVFRYYDPTPEDKPAGWQVPAIETYIVPIFD